MTAIRQTGASRPIEIPYAVPQRSRWRAAGRLARGNPVGTLALAILIGLGLVALLAGQIAPYAPEQTFVGPRLDGPSAQHILGTDRLGRDELSRLLYGARISLRVGFLSVALGTVAGSIIGMISGYFGRTTDMVIQRVMDVLMSIPALLLAIVIVASFGNGANNAMIAIAIVLVPTTSRVMRSVVLQVKARAYVEAAEASGASNARIILRHILPNAIDEMLILASVAVAGAIILEAALAFLGLGAQPPTPSWGQMLADGRLNYQNAPHMVWAPAAFISLTVLVVTLVGDTLRDVLDPKVRGTGRVNLN